MKAEWVQFHKVRHGTTYWLLGVLKDDGFHIYADLTFSSRNKCYCWNGYDVEGVSTLEAAKSHVENKLRESLEMYKDLAL